MSMHAVERFTNPADFLGQARDFLAQRELTCGLKLCVSELLIDKPGVCPDAWFAVIKRGSEICGCALQTPPRNLVISDLDGAAAASLASSVAREDGARVPAVHGPERGAAAFAAAWVQERAVTARTALCMRLFRLHEVIWTPDVRGRLRAARPRDEATILRWFRAFHREAIPEDPVDPVAVACRALEQGRVFVWDCGEPVAMAAVGRELGSSAAIGPVYTPPDRRGHGYATALVAALSQRVLDGGRRYACLFTDLANPVANRIYPRIGYRPVSDFREIAFI